MSSIAAAACLGDALRWEAYGVPCPSIESFSYTFDAGLIRTLMDNGHSRQRRLYTDRPTTYQLTWKVNTAQLHAVEALINERGYKWLYVPMVTGQVPKWMSVDHLIRFISDPEISLEQKDLWIVTIQAEQYKIDPDCFLDLVCDDISSCLKKITFGSPSPPQFLPNTQVLPVNFGAWSNLNG